MSTPRARILAMLSRARLVFASTTLPEFGFLALAITLVGGLAIVLDFATAARLALSLLFLGTVPGAALVRRLLPSAGLLYLVVLGTVAGLGLWALGGMLSHVTGVAFARWIPVGLAVLVWLLPARGGEAHDGSARQDRWVTGAWMVAMLALLPSLKTILATQPARWEGWHSPYADLGFHVAITSEVAARVPQDYPWVSDMALSYPWLFHSAMGVWASGSGVSSADIVLAAWPVLFAALIPAVLGIVAWEISGSKLVAGAAPLIFVLARGLVLFPATMQQVPIFQISPTRDFGNLFLLLAVLAFVRLLGGGRSAAVNRWWWILLALSSFVATGAKASEMPILLGGALCGLFFLIVSRRARMWDFAVFAVFAVSAAVAFLLVLPDRGGSQALSFRPLTFLSPDTPARESTSLVILLLLIVAIVGIWYVVGRAPSGGWLVASLLAGVMLAGVMGLGLLTHPGYSQLYFWESAQPVLAIGLAWCISLAVVGGAVRFAVSAFGVYFGASLIWMLTHQPLVVGAGILLLALGAALYLQRTEVRSGAPSRGRWPRAAATLACAAVLTQAGQLVWIPQGTSGGLASTADDESAIHGTQLAAFEFIRANSQPTDRIITNKHCRSGSISDGTCDPRWFAVAGWSERRVLVEGWGYTQAGASSSVVANELNLSAGFIESPTASESKALVELGVRYVYIDKREAFSRQLANVASLVYETEWADVFRLDVGSASNQQ